MCKSVDKLTNALDKIIHEMIYDNQSYSLENIYKKLENLGIKNKRYEPGVSIKDYFDILLSYDILNIKDGKFFANKDKKDELIIF